MSDDKVNEVRLLIEQIINKSNAKVPVMLINSKIILLQK